MWWATMRPGTYGSRVRRAWPAAAVAPATDQLHLRLPSGLRYASVHQRSLLLSAVVWRRLHQRQQLSLQLIHLRLRCGQLCRHPA